MKQRLAVQDCSPPFASRTYEEEGANEFSQIEEKILPLSVFGAVCDLNFIILYHSCICDYMDVYNKSRP